jgi:hypothetical protein
VTSQQANVQVLCIHEVAVLRERQICVGFQAALSSFFMAKYTNWYFAVSMSNTPLVAVFSRGEP